LPYVVGLAERGLDAVRADPALAKGVNTYKGAVVYEPVAQAHGMEYTALDDLL
jgi:alanine dehydrogenase